MGHLFRALGSSRQTHRAEGRPDFQWRGGQRVWRWRIIGAGGWVHETETGAETFRPFHGDDGGGSRLAWREVLRGASALPAGENSGRYQYGRAESLGKDEGHRGHKLWQFRSRRHAGRRDGETKSSDESKQPAGERHVLPRR